MFVTLGDLSWQIKKIRKKKPKKNLLIKPPKKSKRLNEQKKKVNNPLSDPLLPRHCEERSNLSLLQDGLLRRYASRNDEKSVFPLFEFSK